MAIKPLTDRVVATKEQPRTTTASGILLGEAKEAPAYAVVEAIGPEVKGIKKGDKIIYKEYTATEIHLDDKDHLIIKEEDILAIL
ncbi:co-chaperone GroES [Candidatus Saccharibacteria bacterium]|nr:co-chaperone GroES [Candidatus Saccharibacteria bacterium]